MSASTVTRRCLRRADPLGPYIVALRLVLDDPGGAVCNIEENDEFTVLRAPDRDVAVALWSSTRDDDVADIVKDVARIRPPVAWGVAHALGPVPDRILLTPPPSGTRWVFAWSRAGRTEIVPWGGRLEPELAEWLQVERAESALRHIHDELEKHFGEPTQLYFTPDALTSSRLSPAMLANAVRLVVEDAPRWRLLDVDGQAVVVRRPPGLPLPSLWRRIWLALRRRNAALAEAAARARALDEARLVLAVRGDRVLHQLDMLRQSEWRLTAEVRATHDAHRRTAIAGRIADVRREVRRLHAQLEVMRAQRQIVETQLHHLDLQRLVAAVDLPSQEALATQAAAAKALLANVRDAAALARAADDALATEVPGAPAAVDAILAEFGLSATGPASAAPSQPETDPPRPPTPALPAAADGQEPPRAALAE